MRRLSLILLLLGSGVLSTSAQTLTQDTILARRYFDIGDSILESRSNYDSAIVYFEKAARIYEQYAALKQHFIAQYKIVQCLWFSGRYLESRNLLFEEFDLLQNIQTGEFILDSARVLFQGAIDSGPKEPLEMARSYLVLSQIQIRQRDM